MFNIINSIKLCGRRNCGGCPTVNFTENAEVTITDDYGSTVRMKREEFLDIVRKAAEYATDDELYGPVE
jgi:hypothetical protein